MKTVLISEYFVGQGVVNIKQKSDSGLAEACVEDQKESESEEVEHIGGDSVEHGEHQTKVDGSKEIEMFDNGTEGEAEEKVGGDAGQNDQGHEAIIVEVENPDVFGLAGIIESGDVPNDPDCEDKEDLCRGQFYEFWCF